MVTDSFASLIRPLVLLSVSAKDIDSFIIFNITGTTSKGESTVVVCANALS